MMNILVVAAAALYFGGPQLVPAPDFTYPGNDREAAAYNDRWSTYMQQHPSTAAANLLEMQKMGWILGSWEAQVRDFPSDMKNPLHAEAGEPVAATVDWCVGKRWIRISFSPHPWNAEWTYYLGYDASARQWVLQQILSPASIRSRTLTSGGWIHDRLTFGPVKSSYKGFPETERISFVRETYTRFRIVNEVQMPSGRFVAMDDVVLTKTPL